MLRLVPSDGRDFITPEQTLIRLLDAFDQVVASRKLADDENPRLLSKFEELARMVNPPHLEAVRATYASRHSITIRAWNGDDQGHFILMTVRPNQPIDPLFPATLGGHERRRLAQLLANALGYRITPISD